ncbi:ribonuclease III [Candidatus Nardonella dryophthoridicola]|uniref:Ribonuclease 3 n=1 Tax=endosymbiont of Rhynchophorus ferrugineus TaxID=1972133 RepID=A0A2Z5TPM1_9GAMM|nr:ribonuclease III [Candidatus Nardonella dryophthoridicola]BBA85149.1 ribonuclease 3 [endosymbiont of Rhynchophorus ferrugineus]
MDIFTKIYILEKKIIKYNFKNKNLILKSITHKSFSKINNEKLELLGDSILNFIITKIIYKKYTNLNEGEISNLRSILVKSSTLSKIAKKLKINYFIIISEKKNTKIENSILENVLEAIIGAIFLDSKNIYIIEKFIKKIYYYYFNNIKKIIKNNKNFKSELQNYLQNYKISLPIYKILEIKKKINKYNFVILCKINNLSISEYGYGINKQTAEQNAAKKILNILKKKHKN